MNSMIMLAVMTTTETNLMWGVICVCALFFVLMCALSRFFPIVGVMVSFVPWVLFLVLMENKIYLHQYRFEDWHHISFVFLLFVGLIGAFASLARIVAGLIKKNSGLREELRELFNIS